VRAAFGIVYRATDPVLRNSRISQHPRTPAKSRCRSQVRMSASGPAAAEPLAYAITRFAALLAREQRGRFPPISVGWGAEPDRKSRVDDRDGRIPAAMTRTISPSPIWGWSVLRPPSRSSGRRATGQVVRLLLRQKQAQTDRHGHLVQRQRERNEPLAVGLLAKLTVIFRVCAARPRARASARQGRRSPALRSRRQPSCADPDAAHASLSPGLTQGASMITHVPK
jgi:hypothetical protein